MDWLNTAGSIATIVGVLGALISFLISKIMKISKAVDHLNAETQPNGGKSLRDAVDRMNEKMDRIDRELHRLAGRFEQHITEVQK